MGEGRQVVLGMGLNQKYIIKGMTCRTGLHLVVYKSLNGLVKVCQASLIPCSLCEVQLVKVYLIPCCLGAPTGQGVPHSLLSGSSNWSRCTSFPPPCLRADWSKCIKHPLSYSLLPLLVRGLTGLGVGSKISKYCQ